MDFGANFDPKFRAMSQKMPNLATNPFWGPFELLELLLGPPSSFLGPLRAPGGPFGAPLSPKGVPLELLIYLGKSME